MGYSAFVPCRCYQDGIAAPAPFEILEFDEGRPILAKSQWSRENWEAYDEWLESACDHPRMQMASEWIANVSGMAFLRDTAAEIGEGKLPFLIKCLPRSNEGQVEPEVLPSFLGESKWLRSAGNIGSRAALVHVESGRTACEDSPMLMLSPTHRTGLDQGGFFVFENGEVAFQSSRFTQHELCTSPVRYRLQDAASGATYDSPLPPQLEIGGTATFEVELRALSGEALAYALDPLIRLCDVAINADRPLIWT